MASAPERTFRRIKVTLYFFAALREMEKEKVVVKSGRRLANESR